MGSRLALVVVCVLVWTGAACSGGENGHAAGVPRSARTVSSSILRSRATTTTATIEVADAGAAVLSWTAQHGGRFLDLPAASSRFDSQVAVIDGRVYTAYVDGTLIESAPDGAVLRQRRLPGIATTVVASGRLFVTGTATSPTRAFVELIDPTTLRSIWRAEWDVPASDPSYHGITRPIVSAGAEVLWIGVGSVLERRQIATGRLVASVSVGAQGAAPAVAPDDSTLYTLAPQTTPPYIVLQRRDPYTGALRAAAAGPASVALFPEMVPVSTGVWIAYRTGSLGDATLYARADLHRITDLPGLPRDSQSPEFGMGVAITSSKTNLWVAGISFLACANPSSGAWRHVINGPAPSDGAVSVGLVGIDDGRVVADLGTGLGSFDEHASCPGSR